MGAYTKLIISLISFGSVGVFVSQIPLESAEIVFLRTALGALFLIFLAVIKKETIPKETFKRNFLSMSLSGVVLGASWIFLFEAYRYSTISIGTLTYYLSPVIVLMLSPLVFREKLTSKKLMGIGIAIIGMVLINGGEVGGENPKLGFIYGLGSAVAYATITITNKKREDASALIETIVQLIFASVAVGIFLIIKKSGPIILPKGKALLSLLVLCTYHTGLALYLFFDSLKELPAQSAALLSYIDPVAAIIFSRIFLGEKLSMLQVVGAAMILGGALFGELSREKSEEFAM